MANNKINYKDPMEGHISKFASASGGGFFKTAMNDKKFMEKVSKLLLAGNKNNNTLSQGLSKMLSKK